MTHPSPRSANVGAVAVLVVVMLVWGSTFVITKSAMAEMPPLLLALLRFCIASALLVTLAQAAGGLALLPRPRPWGTLALMGLAGVALYFVAANLALLYTTASAGALIHGSVPAATALLAALFLGEGLNGRRLAGVALSTVGVALVVLATGADLGHAPNPLLGNGLMLVSVLAWVVYTLLSKRLEQVSGLAVTAYSSLLGTLFLVPAALYELTTNPPAAVSWATWLAVFYLGAVASALCFALWNRALRQLDAAQVASFINLVPVVGVASGALVLGEQPVPSQLAGGALVLLGVWLVLR